jgi:hypothetical protein
MMHDVRRKQNTGYILYHCEMVRTTAAYLNCQDLNLNSVLTINTFSYYGVRVWLVSFIILLLQAVASECPPQAGSWQ